MKDAAFGQYFPVDSFVHRLDSRIKILITILYVVAVFFCVSYASYALCIAVVLFCVLLSRVPLKLVLKSIKPILFLITFTVILNLFFTKGATGEVEIDLIWKQFTVENQVFEWGFLRMYFTSIDFAVKMALRLILLVLGPSLLTLTTTPIELTDGIESLLKPLKLIRFPVHELAMIMSIALRLIPTIMEETDKIILAQKARCADFDSRNLFKKAKALLPILIPLFLSSIRRADELAYAMDSRCYRGSKGRTKMKVLKFRVVDFVALFAAAVFFVVLLFLKYNFFGWGWISVLLWSWI